MINKIFIGIAFMLLMSGCDNDGISQADITSLQSSSSIESNDLDKKSYAGLEDVFADTSVIDPNNKYILMVFGANGCKYCEELKKDLKENQQIKDLIKQNFSAYYINLSYSKLHTLNFTQKQYTLSTAQLANFYGIYPTPTLVFATPKGETIISYPAYLPPKHFSALLHFVKDGEWKKVKNDGRKLQESLEKYLRES